MVLGAFIDTYIQVLYIFGKRMNSGMHWWIIKGD
jgi:hypothetical protein